MFEAIFLLAVLYVWLSVGTYAYAVFKNFELMGFWVFKIEKEYIGICKYPQWILGWVYWLGVKLKWI